MPEAPIAPRGAKAPAAQTLYLECASGISGDMVVAALLDLGADEKAMRSALASLPLDGYDIRVARAKANGIDCCDFDVVLDAAHENHDHDMAYLYGSLDGAHADHADHAHHHEHGEHHHEHRTLADVDRIIDATGMEAGAKELAHRIFRIVAEAEGICQLIRLFGLGQEQTARRLGKSQSAVANKLRLLRLPRDVLERLRTEELSERHARALLRLPDEETQRRALDFMIDQRMNVAAAEAYVDALCAPPPAKSAPPGAPRRRSVFLMKDVRLFLNTMDRSLDLMRSGGVDARMEREETDEALIVTVRIAKK